MKKTNFFIIDTLENMKKQYRALCLANHPDHGGDLRTMQDINGEWATILAHAAYLDAVDRQEKAHAEGKKSAGDYHDLNNVEEILRREIIFVLNLGLNVDVELMGLWIWVTGDTKEHAPAFHDHNVDAEIKWKWSFKKMAWYFAGVPTFSRKNVPLEQIRATYGSIQFTEKDLNVTVN